MPQSKSSVRPLKDPEVRRVCTLSGLQGKLAEKRLIQLRDLEEGLKISIRDAEEAIGSESFWGTALISAKWVKVACDVFIDIAADFAGPAGTAVSIVYDRASLVVDGLNGDLDAQKLGQHAAEIHIDALSSAFEYMGQKSLGMLVSKSKTLIKAQLAVEEIIRDRKSNASSGVASAQRTALSQLQRIREQISALSVELENCRPPAAQLH